MILLLLAMTASATDLDEARERARRSASSVELARAQAEAAEFDANAARGANLPVLTGFANITVGDGYTAIGFERPVPWQAGVGIDGTWTLVNPSRWAAAAAARRTASGRVAMLAWTQALARQDVTTAYARVEAASIVADALDEAARDAASAQQAVESLVQAGVRPPADGARARADALDLRALAAGARGEVAATCARLQALLDEAIDGRCSVEPVDWTQVQPAEGPDRHPAIEAFSEAAGAARASSRAVLYSHLPSVDASGTAAEYAVPDRTGPGWVASIGINVPLTLLTTGTAESRSARSELQRAQADLDRQERDLAVARVQAEARLEAARQVDEARRAGVEASKLAWDRVDRRFQEGLEDLTTWLTARRARIDAQVAAANAQAELAAAIAAVEAARGVD